MPFETRNKGQHFVLENELPVMDANPYPHLPAWISLNWNFKSDYFSFSPRKRKKLKDFLEHLRGPYYVNTAGRMGQIVEVAILHTGDRDSFRKAYPRWKEDQENVADNLQVVALQILAEYKPSHPKLRALFQQVESTITSHGLQKTFFYGTGFKPTESGYRLVKFIEPESKQAVQDHIETAMNEVWASRRSAASVPRANYPEARHC